MRRSASSTRKGSGARLGKSYITQTENLRESYARRSKTQATIFRQRFTPCSEGLSPPRLRRGAVGEAGGGGERSMAGRRTDGREKDWPPPSHARTRTHTSPPPSTHRPSITQHHSAALRLTRLTRSETPHTRGRQISQRLAPHDVGLLAKGVDFTGGNLESREAVVEGSIQEDVLHGVLHS
jgi:hypothetical protein